MTVPWRQTGVGLTREAMKVALHPDAAAIVVGVGASAGGLEAMLQMFGQVQANGQVAYVVAQHMAHGGHADLVVRVIQRESVLPVCVGSDGQVLKPDQVYVIPADHDGVVKGGVLALLPPAPERVSTPSVNVLMESLARHMGPRAWAIVLSGAGWDGARGCCAVQRAGGVVVAQDHDDAGFPSMPDAVVEAGCTARRMKAAQIGPWIAQRLGQESPESQMDKKKPADFRRQGEAATLAPEDPPQENLRAVISRVHEVTGIDFSEYRQETLLRRLQSRRNHLELDPDRYQALLMRDRQEAERLQRLFLVSLSSFWRDPDCFDALSKALFQRLADRGDDDPIRIWVPGCASGEEVYTLAAILVDAREQGRLHRPVELIGTDLNEQALQQAKAGEYQAKSFKGAPAGWSDRWFIKAGDAFRVQPELARHVRFLNADIELGLPREFPLGQVDLISCRNLLIYFLPSKQQRLLTLFHDALRPNGLLMIGPSESLGPAAQASFRVIDADRRVFARRS